MLPVLLVMSLLLTGVTMGLSLAHALEFPGKLRLDEATYRAVQTIYYPGFTIGGLIGEFGGMIVLAVLLYLTPANSDQFGLILPALAMLIACHLTYWTVTHPVNQAWLKKTDLGPLIRFFFGLFATPNSDWRRMRDIWEWSHVGRATFAGLSFLLMTWALLL